MSLDVLLCLIPPNTMHVGGGEPVYHRPAFFFVLSLSSPKKHRLVLFIVDISTSFLIILISNFYPWLFFDLVPI
jgi:hypothetical protein